MQATEATTSFAAADSLLTTSNYSNIKFSNKSVLDGNVAGRAGGAVSIVLLPPLPGVAVEGAGGVVLVMTITDCIFTANVAGSRDAASSLAGTGGLGLASFIHLANSNSNTNSSGSTLFSSPLGGAIFLYEPALVPTYMMNSRNSSNTNTSLGQASASACSLEVIGSVFSGNECRSGAGGALAAVACVARLNGTTFTGNAATYGGGAVAYLSTLLGNGDADGGAATEASE